MEIKQWSEGDSPSGLAEGGMAWQILWCGIQEITKASQGILGETRGCSINEVGPPWGTYKLA